MKKLLFFLGLICGIDAVYAGERIYGVNDPIKGSVARSAKAQSSVQKKKDIQVLFLAEVGYVCANFDEELVSQKKALHHYLIMRSVCGNKEIAGTGAHPRTVEVVIDWLVKDLRFDEDFVMQLVEDMAEYGGSLRFYDAVDGYRRYIYMQPYWSEGKTMQSAEY